MPIEEAITRVGLVFFVCLVICGVVFGLTILVLYLGDKKGWPAEKSIAVLLTAILLPLFWIMVYLLSAGIIDM